MDHSDSVLYLSEGHSYCGLSKHKAHRLIKCFKEIYELELDTSHLHPIFSLWGFLRVGLFATLQSKKAPKYCSWADVSMFSKGECVPAILEWDAFLYFPSLPSGPDKSGLQNCAIQPRTNSFTFPRTGTCFDGALLHKDILKVHLTAWRVGPGMTPFLKRLYKFCLMPGILIPECPIIGNGIVSKTGLVKTRGECPFTCSLAVVVY